MPIIVDVYKTILFVNVLGSWTRGLVVNRAGKTADISNVWVEQFIGRALGAVPVMADISEDTKVQEAEREGVSAVVYEPDCEASVAINVLAKVVAGEPDLPCVPYEASTMVETTSRLI